MCMLPPVRVHQLVAAGYVSRIAALALMPEYMADVLLQKEVCVRMFVCACLLYTHNVYD